MTEEMTSAEYLAQIAEAEPKKNKYNAIKVKAIYCPDCHYHVAGEELVGFSETVCPKCGTALSKITFDSKAEYRRYPQLALLLHQVEITDLRIHPKYMVLGAFKDMDGTEHDGVIYEGDFEYKVPGKGGYTVEDVKGKMTKEFKIKEMLFRKKFEPKYRLIVLSSKEV